MGIRILDVQDVEAPNDLNQEETYKKGENGQDGQDGQVFSYLNIRDMSNNNSFNSQSLKIYKNLDILDILDIKNKNINKNNKPDSTTTTDGYGVTPVTTVTPSTLHDQILNTIRNLDQQNDGEGAEEGELERIINHPDFSKLFNDMKQNAEVYIGIKNLIPIICHLTTFIKRYACNSISFNPSMILTFNYSVYT